MVTPIVWNYTSDFPTIPKAYPSLPPILGLIHWIFSVNIIEYASLYGASRNSPEINSIHPYLTC